MNEQELLATAPILFNFKGKRYEVGREAYDNDKIVLPDGTLIHVGNWSESSPPEPNDMYQIEHVFGSNPQAVAENLGAAIARSSIYPFVEQTGPITLIITSWVKMMPRIFDRWNDDPRVSVGGPFDFPLQEIILEVQQGSIEELRSEIERFLATL